MCGVVVAVGGGGGGGGGVPHGLALGGPAAMDMNGTTALLEVYQRRWLPLMVTHYDESAISNSPSNSSW